MSAGRKASGHPGLPKRCAAQPSPALPACERLALCGGIGDLALLRQCKGGEAPWGDEVGLCASGAGPALAASPAAAALLPLPLSPSPPFPPLLPACCFMRGMHPHQAGGGVAVVDHGAALEEEGLLSVQELSDPGLLRGGGVGAEGAAALWWRQPWCVTQVHAKHGAMQ